MPGARLGKRSLLPTTISVIVHLSILFGCYYFSSLVETYLSTRSCVSPTATVELVSPRQGQANSPSIFRSSSSPKNKVAAATIAEPEWQAVSEEKKQEFSFMKSPSLAAPSPPPPRRESFSTKRLLVSKNPATSPSQEKTTAASSSQSQAATAGPTNKSSEDLSPSNISQPGKVSKVPPKILRKIAPSYPQRARRRGWQGVVVLKVEVRASGQVGRIKVVEAPPYSVLRKAAVRAVKKWRFQPALEGDRPIVSWITLPVRFRLPR